jgi:hypothetical protein
LLSMICLLPLDKELVASTDIEEPNRRYRVKYKILFFIISL